VPRALRHDPTNPPTGFLTHFLRKEYGTFRLYSGNEGSQVRVPALRDLLLDLLQQTIPVRSCKSESRQCIPILIYAYTDIPIPHAYTDIPIPISLSTTRYHTASRGITRHHTASHGITRHHTASRQRETNRLLQIILAPSWLPFIATPMPHAGVEGRGEERRGEERRGERGKLHSWSGRHAP